MQKSVLICGLLKVFKREKKEIKKLMSFPSLIGEDKFHFASLPWSKISAKENSYEL